MVCPSNYFKSIRQEAAHYAFINRSTRFQLILAKTLKTVQNFWTFTIVF